MSKLLPLSQGKHAIVDDDLFEYLNQWKWHYRRDGYVCHREGNTTVYLHRVITQCPQGMVVDHKNRNTLDNRRTNLRVCTQSQNNLNQRLRSDSKSGLKGVTEHANKRKRWQAHLRVGGRKKSLGYYLTKEEAHAAYIKVAKNLHGEFFTL